MIRTAQHSALEADRDKFNLAILEQILREELRVRLALLYSSFFFMFTVVYCVLLWLLPHVISQMPSLLFSFWQKDFWEWSNAVWFTPAFIMLLATVIIAFWTKNEALDFALQSGIIDELYLYEYNKSQGRIAFVEIVLAVCASLLTITVFF